MKTRSKMEISEIKEVEEEEGGLVVDFVKSPGGFHSRYAGRASAICGCKRKMLYIPIQNDFPCRPFRRTRTTKLALDGAHNISLPRISVLGIQRPPVPLEVDILFDPPAFNELFVF